MFRLLRQPSPIDEPASRSWLRAALIGGFVGVFLLIFQPFGIDGWVTDNKTLKVLGFGIITFVVLLINWLVLPILFPKFFSDAQWTVGREIARFISFIVVIAIGNRIYLDWLIGLASTPASWVWSIAVTLLVGIFPTTGAVVASYIIKLRQYARQAADLSVLNGLSASQSANPVPTTPSSTKAAGESALLPALTLVAENEKDQLTLAPADLLYVESSDNYCTVVYLNNGQPVKPLLRSSLARLEGQIGQPHIVRCHRSYVVNLDRVERVTGNAQGYKLHLLGGQFQIPVARKYNDTLIAELRSL